MLSFMLTALMSLLVYMLGSHSGYRRGRSEGRANARSVFVEQIKLYKSVLDDLLKESIHVPRDQIILTVNGTTIVDGPPQKAAQKSLELGALIETIDEVLPV